MEEVETNGMEEVEANGMEEVEANGMEEGEANGMDQVETNGTAVAVGTMAMGGGNHAHRRRIRRCQIQMK